MKRKPALQRRTQAQRGGSLSPNSLINSRVPPTPPPHDHERGRAMPCRAVRNGCICMLSHLHWINPTVTLTSDHRLLFSAGWISDKSNNQFRTNHGHHYQHIRIEIIADALKIKLDPPFNDTEMPSGERPGYINLRVCSFILL
uniref:Uncharacterized protein n=1 Tax=Oryza meridionalis TaxID=40149 RepID=A0A0E0CCQ6_9ORYZ